MHGTFSAVPLSVKAVFATGKGYTAQCAELIKLLCALIFTIIYVRSKNQVKMQIRNAG